MRKLLVVALVAALTIFGFGIGSASADGHGGPHVETQTTGFLVEAACGYSSMVNGCTKGPIKYQATDITPKLYSAPHSGGHHSAPHSLAYTGVETTVAAVGGVSLLIAGALVMNTRRRIAGLI